MLFKEYKRLTVWPGSSTPKNIYLKKKKKKKEEKKKNIFGEKTNKQTNTAAM